jgi:hypothetical protein
MPRPYKSLAWAKAGRDYVLNFESGCWGDQSDGGNLTLQNVGLGVANWTPISRPSAWRSPLWTTVHSTKVFVCLFNKTSRCPIFTGDETKINAPEGLILIVYVFSLKDDPSSSYPETFTPVRINIRWLLRRFDAVQDASIAAAMNLFRISCCCGSIRVNSRFMPFPAIEDTTRALASNESFPFVTWTIISVPCGNGLFVWAWHPLKLMSHIFALMRTPESGFTSSIDAASL